MLQWIPAAQRISTPIVWTAGAVIRTHGFGILADPQPPLRGSILWFLHHSNLVTLLIASRHFRVDDRQLHVWIELLPPTEANRSACPVPGDDPRTRFNETGS